MDLEWRVASVAVDGLAVADRLQPTPDPWQEAVPHAVRFESWGTKQR